EVLYPPGTKITAYYKGNDEYQGIVPAYIARLVVYQYTQYTYRRQQHSQRCALCRLLRQAKKKYQGRYYNDTPANAHHTAQKTCGDTYHQQQQECCYIHSFLVCHCAISVLPWPSWHQTWSGSR